MKIAIIGAGASGLTSIKCCLDEGLEPICLERDHDLGGLWRYEDAEKGGGTVYKTTVINSSKETLAFSDYPIPKEYANFMHHRKVMEYYNAYTDEFGLRKHIRFNSSVVAAKHAPDFNKTGRWELEVENTVTKKREKLLFDGVMVAIGHHARPYLPSKDFPGLDNFKGTYSHSNSYRDSSPYENKKVVIVGTGNSGCDIAVELSRNAKQTFLSTRRGAWVFNRIMDNGVPFDLIVITRFQTWIMNHLSSLANPLFESVLNKRFDHEKYGLKPKHRVLGQHPTINDELPNRIVNGTVIVKSNISRFTEKDVIFDDGSREQVDSVIFATGYRIGFPFLDDEILKIEGNDPTNLYKLIWPMNQSHNTLAIIGLTQPLGVIAPVSELQARWATRVFNGKCKLPSQQKMEDDYREMKKVMKRRYIGSPRHTIEVDGVIYMDGVAEMMNCKPNIPRLLLTDPRLAWNIVMGPFTSVQYRLTGPGKWEDARKTILTQWGRVWYPMKRGPPSDKTGFFFISLFVLLLAAAAMIFHRMCC